MEAPDLPIQSLNSSTGKPTLLPIPYKVMQPITIRAALDRVGRGVQLGGVWAYLGFLMLGFTMQVPQAQIPLL